MATYQDVSSLCAQEAQDCVTEKGGIRGELTKLRRALWMMASSGFAVAAATELPPPVDRVQYFGRRVDHARRTGDPEVSA